jgi:hypothetical protein
MARIALFLSTLFFVSACAEIIPLTGGKKDEFAPKPVSGKQLPEQGALHVNTQEFSVVFNEYFKLQDPNTTITMNPSVGKLTTTQKNKSLTIRWEDSLAANTTYILQLNGTIRDINESNDSIMRFVFSTGSTIDSLVLKGNTVQSFTNGVVGSVSVGLYEIGTNPYTTQPIYAARTDNKGSFDFSYLKDGTFDIFGFIDQNKNQEVDKNEIIGFADHPISTRDTLPITLRMFQPIVSLEKLQVKIEKPGIAVLSGRTLDEKELRISGNSPTLLHRYREDSIRVSLPIDETGNYLFIYQNDTVFRNLPLMDRTANFPIQNQSFSNNWKVGDTLLFGVNEHYIHYDSKKITILASTGEQKEFDIREQEHQLQVIPHNLTEPSFTIHFDAGAITGIENSNDSISFPFKTLTASDLSELSLDCSTLTGNWLIQVLDGEKVVAETSKPDGINKVIFNRMIPGQYTIRCVEDVNKNGHWDTGSYPEKKQAEKVLRFALKQKLRANWDVEEVLKID